MNPSLKLYFLCTLFLLVGFTTAGALVFAETTEQAAQQLTENEEEVTTKDATTGDVPHPTNREIPKIPKYDGCTAVGDVCTCSNTGWVGRCVEGTHYGRGLSLYCQCD